MKRIAELILILPHNDPIIAGKLLAKRDFSELAMLVWSDIVKVQKAQVKKHCPEEYKNIELEDLLELKMIIDKYNIDSLYEE